MPRRVAEIEGAATIDPRQQVVVLVEIGNVAHSHALVEPRHVVDGCSTRSCRDAR
jgi:hypothetical protein